jgi:transposase
MSLQPGLIPPVPENTAHVAHAAFPDGNPSLQLRDELGTLFVDADFADLDPWRGQPALAPWRLALVTVLQFRENPSDRRTADAVRVRIDWKYRLGLELTDPGCDDSVLCEFRSRLLAGDGEGLLLETLRERCTTMGWLKAGGRQRTDSTHVLTRVRATTRRECARAAWRHARNRLAVVAPDWLRDRSPSHGVDRSGRRPDESRLPSAQGDRQAFAGPVGADGHAPWGAASGPGSPPWLGEVPAVATRRRVWLPQCSLDAGRVRWRTEAEGIPPARPFLSAPHDVEARSSKKRSASGVGSKVHRTATCEDEAPHRIVPVATTPAPVAEGDVTPAIPAALRGTDLLPGQPMADTASVAAEWLVDRRREYGVDRIGPTRPDSRWQSRAGEGVAASDCASDWDRPHATGPTGRTSARWSPAVDRGPNEVIKIKCSTQDCGVCPARDRCTAAKRRSITVRPRDPDEAWHATRSREASEEYRTEYHRRAGIEGTISQGVRICGLRRSRSIHVTRISDWLAGRPREGTSTSAFARLMDTSIAA